MEKKIIKRVPDCRSETLMGIVADVESYGEFVPLCKEVKIVEHLEEESQKKKFKANVLIEYKFFKEAFIAVVSVNNKDYKIIIESNTSPFNKLYSEWCFEQLEKDCLVTFRMNASFNSFLIEKIISLSFDRIAKKVISAFEGRAISGRFI